MAEIINSGTITWGCDGTVYNGWVQTATFGKGASTKELRKADGDVGALAVYDEHETISISVYMSSSTTLPAVGGTFTYDGTTYYCTSAQIDYSNEDGAKFSLSGRTYPSLVAAKTNSGS